MRISQEMHEARCIVCGVRVLCKIYCGTVAKVAGTPIDGVFCLVYFISVAGHFVNSFAIFCQLGTDALRKQHTVTDMHIFLLLYY